MIPASRSAFRLAIMFLVILRGGLQALAHELDILLGRPNTGRRLFLKRVKDVHSLLKSNGVNGPIRVSVVRFDDLEHARTELLPRLCRRCRSADCAMPRAFPMSSFTA